MGIPTPGVPSSPADPFLEARLNSSLTKPCEDSGDLVRHRLQFRGEGLLQNAIQLLHLMSQSAEEKFASVRKQEDTLADRPDLIAELQSYLQEAGMLAPHRARRISWARLKVLAEFL